MEQKESEAGMEKDERGRRKEKTSMSSQIMNTYLQHIYRELELLDPPQHNENNCKQ